MSVSAEKRKSMSILNVFRPAPYVEEIQDTSLVKEKYRYWRLRTFIGMYVGYAFYYFSRKSFTFAMPALSQSLGFDKAELGMLGSVLSISYGVSKFLSGILGDKSNPRYFMAIGLILTGMFNLFFGMSSTLLFFAIFWGLNGWFQGWGWPGCAKLLTHWYSHSERGTWWSLWNTSHNLGGAAIPIIAALCVEYLGWRYAMYVPGVLCILAGLFVINRLRDTPQSLGLPPIEKFRNDYQTNKIEKEKASLSTKEILFDFVLKNRFIWILAVSYFFIYIIRTAVNDWSLLYLVEEKKYSTLTAGACVCWFEIGGFLGSLVAGWSSDKLFNAKRNPVNFIFTAGVLGAVLFLWKMPGMSPILDSFTIFVIGFFIFGPQMLIGIAAAELSHKKAAATATGFAGCFAYLGAATAGLPLGSVMKVWGWEGYFMILAVCSVIAALLFIPIWSAKTNPKLQGQA
jgi:MFS transporter, OPA family, sugar phosphate sensor protein UhpC